MGTSPTHSARTLTASAAAVCLAIALVSCGDETGPTGPDPLELPITWEFDGGLEGWTLGSRTSGDGGGSAIHDAGGSSVVLSGHGAPGTADAWMSRQVTLPDGAAGEVWIDVAGMADCLLRDEGDTHARITVTPSNGSTTIVEDWRRVAPADMPVVIVGGSLEQFAGETVTITIEQDDEGEQEEGGETESVCVSRIEIFDD